MMENPTVAGREREVNMAAVKLEEVISKEAHLISDLAGLLSPVLHVKDVASEGNSPPKNLDLCSMALRLEAMANNLNQQCSQLGDLCRFLEIA